MKIEKIKLNEGYYTPDSEKDSLESAHISGDELTLVKNGKKILENQRMEEINENVEEIDLTSNKEGMHVDQWPRPKNERSMERFESPEQISKQKAIREARNKAINTEAA